MPAAPFWIGGIIMKWGTTQMDKEWFNRFFTKESASDKKAVGRCMDNFADLCNMNKFDLCSFGPVFCGPETTRNILEKSARTGYDTWRGLDRMFSRPVINDRHLFLWSRKTGKRCFVSNPFIPDDIDDFEWAKKISDYAQMNGLCVQMSPDKGFYKPGSCLVVFSLDGDIALP